MVTDTYNTHFNSCNVFKIFYKLDDVFTIDHKSLSSLLHCRNFWERGNLVIFTGRKMRFARLLYWEYHIETGCEQVHDVNANHLRHSLSPPALCHSNHSLISDVSCCIIVIHAHRHSYTQVYSPVFFIIFCLILWPEAKLNDRAYLMSSLVFNEI